ncbi:unnamed protein product [Brassica oleracea]|uniref:(rape) hypothetical protein n=1 Tax=Brassica napus TaxID=3708 RepID=A0A816NC61_BRANA|nr:unnamed protein product [Brassica napus]
MKLCLHLQAEGGSISFPEGCCGVKKTQEKVMMVKPSSKSSSDHLHSGCCGDKQQDNVKVLVKDGCCDEKTKKPDGDIYGFIKLMQKEDSCAKDKEKLKGNSGKELL